MFCVGVDIDLAALRTRPVANLLQADITHLPLRKHFDLVLVRHPDIDKHPRDWRMALTGVPGWLAPQGCLLLTTYNAAEMDLMRGWLLNSPLKPSVLPESRLAPVGVAGRDRYALMYRRS